MSVIDKLNNIINCKNAIREAINNKGGALTESSKLRDYATAIDNLTGGGGENRGGLIKVHSLPDNKYDTTGYYTVGHVGMLYGQGWYHNKERLGIKIVKFGMYSYISEKDMLKAKEYYEHHYDGHKSFLEYDVVDFIKSIYDGEILMNKRTIIPPLELDIYIPAKKLAIEVNGLFYHSSLNNNIDKIIFYVILGVFL